MNTALTIAGSDSCGGAGIQADIKTMTALGIYAMSAVTALTAQNTMRVAAISEVSPEFLKMQLDCVFTDIFPDAVKIGMVSSASLIGTIADCLKFYNAGNIVVDPVMISTSGSALISENAAEVLAERIFPLAELVTPNIPEAELISGKKIYSVDDMADAAAIIGRKYGCSVLVKGGHSKGCADDILWCANKTVQFHGERICNSNTHGTGCTLSSAIACGLAKGMTLEKSISEAKQYLTNALSAMLNIGKGNGPLNHCWNIKGSES
jgi:hydroxymethylpyrimidine/phosphomethylpyrimidine kinase